MSFILDALKKSEAERQRQSGPTLLELRITQPRRRYPAWALWVGVLLALNVAVLLYALLLRHPVAAGPAMAGVVAATGTAVAAPPVTSLRASAPGVPPNAAGVATAPAPAPAPAPGVATAAAPATGASAAATLGVTAVAPLAPPSTVGSAAAANNTAVVSANPADDEPAVPASAATSPPVNYAELPSLASLGGDMPALQLNLLDYSPLAAERFALINMHRVREGDVLPEGPRVLAITREGVAMDYRGQDFMLRSSGSGPSP